MFWLIFATGTAIFESLKDVASKHSLKNVNEYLVSWSLFAFSSPLLLPLLLFIEIPTLNFQFFLALIIGGSLNLIAFIIYTKAINLADLSLTVPLVTFTPLFLLVTSPLIVGEYPTISDTIGIFLIVTGSYLLNLGKRKRGYLAPFQAIVQEKGSMLMLGVAFLWSITANIDKVGVRNSSPIFWAIANYTFIALEMLPVLLYKSKGKVIQPLKTNLFALIPVGFFQGLVVLCQMKAIELALVAQVISVKRISTLFSVFWGYLFFRESGIKERATGAIFMILGVFLIAI